MNHLKCSKCGARARASHPTEIDRRNKKDKLLCRTCVLVNDAKHAAAAFWRAHDHAHRQWFNFTFPYTHRQAESRAYRERLRDTFEVLRGRTHHGLRRSVMSALVADYSEGLPRAVAENSLLSTVAARLSVIESTIGRALPDFNVVVERADDGERTINVRWTAPINMVRIQGTISSAATLEEEHARRHQGDDSEPDEAPLLSCVVCGADNASVDNDERAFASVVA